MEQVQFVENLRRISRRVPVSVIQSKTSTRAYEFSERSHANKFVMQFVNCLGRTPQAKIIRGGRISPSACTSFSRLNYLLWVTFFIKCRAIACPIKNPPHFISHDCEEIQNRALLLLILIEQEIIPQKIGISCRNNRSNASTFSDYRRKIQCFSCVFS